MLRAARARKKEREGAKQQCGQKEAGSLLPPSPNPHLVFFNSFTGTAGAGRGQDPYKGQGRGSGNRSRDGKYSSNRMYDPVWPFSGRYLPIWAGWMVFYASRALLV